MELRPPLTASTAQPLSTGHDLTQQRMQQAAELPGSSNRRLGGQAETAPSNGSPELKEAFTEFVGQTLFGSMLASMRKTVGKPAYMHGGRTEEVFQQQLDQLIVEDMTKAS